MNTRKYAWLIGLAILPMLLSAQTLSRRVYLGAGFEPPGSGRYGARVTSLQPNAGLAQIGLRTNDVILFIDDSRIETAIELEKKIRTSPCRSACA